MCYITIAVSDCSFVHRIPVSIPRPLATMTRHDQLAVAHNVARDLYEEIDPLSMYHERGWAGWTLISGAPKEFLRCVDTIMRTMLDNEFPW